MARLVESTEPRRRMMLTTALLVFQLILLALTLQRRHRRPRIQRALQCQESGRMRKVPKQDKFVVLEEQVNPPTPTEKSNESEASSRPKRASLSTRNESVSDDQSEATSRTKRACRSTGNDSESDDQSEASSRPMRARLSTRNDTESDDLVAELKTVIKAAADWLRSMVEETETIKKQRKMLYKEIRKIEGLTTKQAMVVAIDLVKDDNVLQFFFSLDSDRRKLLAQSILGTL